MNENKHKQTEPELIVLVDMDGVLADLVKGWMKEWNKRYPDRPAEGECYTFYIEDSFADLGTKEELQDVFYQPGFFYDLEPIPGAIEALKQMEACGIDLTICTSPTLSKGCWQEKADWVEHYLGKEWLNKLIMTKDKTFVMGDFLIDDKPQIKGLYTPTWEHVLFSQPYNDIEGDKRLRIDWKTWPKILTRNARR